MEINQIGVAQRHSDQFRPDFIGWLMDNSHLYAEFEKLALSVAGKRPHYGARAIVEVMRFNSAIRERDGIFKINGNYVPCMARLFALCHPQHADLFEFREHRAAA